MDWRSYPEIVYQYIWYYAEFWVRKSHLRRPFTFIMRDHPWTFWCIVTPILGVSAYFSKSIIGYLLINTVWSMLVAHLWWGSKYIVGEQEKPTFDPLHPVSSVKAIREARYWRN